MPCPCEQFELDPDTEDSCHCGHVHDEHRADGHCIAPMET